MQAVSTFGPNKDNIIVVNQKQKMPRAQGKPRVTTLGLKKKDFLKTVEETAAQADQSKEHDQSIIGKDYFRNPEVNQGFYSKKRAGVADVDPKVSV